MGQQSQQSDRDMIFFLFVIPVISKPSDVIFFEQQSVLFSFYPFTTETGYAPLQVYHLFHIFSLHPGSEADSPNSSLDDREVSLSQYLLCQQSPELAIPESI